jgi:hypothetical protein
MKTTKFAQWLAVPVVVAIAAIPGLAQPIAVNPNSQPIQLTGTSGGTQRDAGCAGYIAATPNHVVQITADTDLRFVLQSQGQPALLIRGASGQDFCVPADAYSAGKVEIPGRWRKGLYSVFVGDRANGKHPYTLSIAQ